MKIQSMTGFSRASGEHAGALIAWEARSVNGKSVELRLRLPPGYERIEASARLAVQRRFQRGSIQASLTVVRPTGSTPAPVVNTAFLGELAELATRLQKLYGLQPASADGLLGLRGVLEIPEVVETEEERAAGEAAILSVLEQALEGLGAARIAEGAALRTVLLKHIDDIEILTERAAADPSRQPTQIRARLAEQLQMLMDAAAGLDEQRLHAEAAFLATKADIHEEIDRLKTHVASARALLDQGGVVGRKLDFLAQEFNRESNTLCSKSNAAAVTATGLELKAVVDRFREQVQNLE